jgi:SAM-dependent methyltransferase
MSAADRARWDARYRAAGGVPGGPSPFLLGLDAVLPRGDGMGPAPRALDVAGGSGRNAVWLAQRGLEVTCADISSVGLARAGQAADAAGVSLRRLAIDLETEPFPGGPFALVVSIDFLHRPLFAAFADALSPGGLLVFAQATRANLARHPHPSARFLLDDGELPGLVRGVGWELEVLRCEEGWFDDRHEARLVARRPAA